MLNRLLPMAPLLDARPAKLGGWGPQNGSLVLPPARTKPASHTQQAPVSPGEALPGGSFSPEHLYPLSCLKCPHTTGENSSAGQQETGLLVSWASMDPEQEQQGASLPRSSQEPTGAHFPQGQEEKCRGGLRLLSLDGHTLGSWVPADRALAGQWGLELSPPQLPPFRN